MNEDYYYSNATTNEIKLSTDVVKEADIYYSDNRPKENGYYDSKTYSRAEFIKLSPHVDEKVKSLRFCGGCMVVCVIIDLIRIYRVDIEIDIESYIKMAAIIMGIMLTLEAVTQIWAFPACNIAQLILSFIFIYKSYFTFAFLCPPGILLLVASAYHVEQSYYLESRWKHYMRTSSS